ncbi:hypothetical protein BpHYR1_005912 [Brachionus plicatilis]|uniref:Uncharacterized protein n=1 Tax=Brachionus plicatilis TaxID=10195 RepID=A0A3M7T3S9_BRAPC|nr:hypothetical protein BpHYR1_005912 [Brachionus plicatilis]
MDGLNTKIENSLFTYLELNAVDIALPNFDSKLFFVNNSLSNFVHKLSQRVSLAAFSFHLGFCVINQRFGFVDLVRQITLNRRASRVYIVETSGKKRNSKLIHFVPHKQKFCLSDCIQIITTFYLPVRQPMEWNNSVLSPLTRVALKYKKFLTCNFQFSKTNSYHSNPRYSIAPQLSLPFVHLEKTNEYDFSTDTFIFHLIRHFSCSLVLNTDVEPISNITLKPAAERGFVLRIEVVIHMIGDQHWSHKGKDPSFLSIKLLYIFLNLKEVRRCLLNPDCSWIRKPESFLSASAKSLPAALVDDLASGTGDELLLFALRRFFLIAFGNSRVFASVADTEALSIGVADK